jgi:molybdopterin-guanine dinucleotide biosynthesis protein A
MGHDKALLPWGDADLLAHALHRLRAVCPDVRVLSGPEPRYADRGAEVVTDVVTDTAPEAGTLGGIVAGLLAAEAGLFLAVDLPFVPVPLLAHLVRLAGDADAVVPVSPRGPEPLCAVYGRACREPARRALAEGRLKMTAFWSEVRVREVGPAELAGFGDPDRLFRNLNTAADYAAAREDGD